MELWLSRHGIRIRELRSSLSASSSEKAGTLLQSFGSLIRAFGPSVLFRICFYGINITFPDGVIISIKQGSSFGIHRFIDLYNRKIQEEQSCLL